MTLGSLYAALIALPVAFGAVAFLIDRTALRSALVVTGSLIVAGLSIATALTFGGADSVFFGLPGDLDLGSALLVVGDRPDDPDRRLWALLPPPPGADPGPRATGRLALPGAGRASARNRAGPPLLVRPPVAGDGARHRRHRPADLHQRRRLHARLPPRQPDAQGTPQRLLRTAVRLSLGHVRAGGLELPAAAAGLLGNHHPLLVPADRLHPYRRDDRLRLPRPEHEPGGRRRLRGGHRSAGRSAGRPGPGGTDARTGRRRTAAGDRAAGPGRHRQERPDAVQLVADRGHVRPLPHFGPPPLFDDGQGRGLPAAAPLAGHGRIGGGLPRRLRGDAHLPVRVDRGRHRVEHQEGPGLLHHRQPGADRRLRRPRHARAGLGGGHAHHLPRHGQEPAVPHRWARSRTGSTPRTWRTSTPC